MSRSVMQHSFAQVPSVETKRSVFNRSHGYKTTIDFDKLYPVFVEEVLPGDTHILNASIFARLATPKLPIMDNMIVESFYFFVPDRTVWDNFKVMMGEVKNPDDTTDFYFPQIEFEGIASLSVHDYMGLPVYDGTETLSVSAMWHRAMNKIFNEFFRDQNLQDSLDVPTDDGPDDPSIYTIQRINKKHDYFTSCLPEPQKGPAALLPLGATANVLWREVDDIPLGQGDGKWTATKNDGSSALASGYNMFMQHDMLPNKITTFGLTFGGGGEAIPGNPTNEMSLNPNGSLYADLTSATQVTINSLRQAFQLQKMLERDMRSGTRYVETLKAHWNVISPDFTQQRAQFLGGGKIPVGIHPVQQTSETTANSPQGNLSAFGTVNGGSGFTHSFTEHGRILGFIAVRADLTYQQGLHKKWTRLTKYDSYWPVFQGLGEQVVKTQELVWTPGDTVNNNKVFGYQEYGAEYRYKNSEITGLFRSNVTTGFTSLDAWHLSQVWSGIPTLSSDFIKSDTPISRCIAVPSEPHLLVDIYYDYKSIRCMPIFGVPGMVDHF